MRNALLLSFSCHSAGRPEPRLSALGTQSRCRNPKTYHRATQEFWLFIFVAVRRAIPAGSTGNYRPFSVRYCRGGTPYRRANYRGRPTVWFCNNSIILRSVGDLKFINRVLHDNIVMHRESVSFPKQYKHGTFRRGKTFFRKNPLVSRWFGSEIFREKSRNRVQP